jgi:hypothetical protein
MQVFVSSPLSKEPLSYICENRSYESVVEKALEILSCYNIQNLYISNEKAVRDHLLSSSLFPVFLNFSCRLVGGKGGFGSQLKTQGAKMDKVKITNFQSCRDLQGRRLRTVHDTNLLMSYLATEEEKQAAKRSKLEDKLRKTEKLIEKSDEIVNGGSSSSFIGDDTLVEETMAISERVKLAVASSLNKSVETQVKKRKPISLGFGFATDESESETESETESGKKVDKSGKEERTGSKRIK